MGKNLLQREHLLKVSLIGHKVQAVFLFDLLCLNKAFTLFEMFIVLIVLSIMSALVFLQLAPFIARSHLQAAARQITSDLQYARTKAIAQNSRFRVTFRPRTQDYIVERNEDGIWHRQLLHSHSTADTPNAVIALPLTVLIIAINSGGDIIFLPRGAVDGGMTITLGSSSGAETRRVIVNLAGRVRIE